MEVQSDNLTTPKLCYRIKQGYSIIWWNILVIEKETRFSK